MKPFLILLASSISLGIHAQAAVDRDARISELHATYTAFQEAVATLDKSLSETLGHTALKLSERLYGADHLDTAKLTYQVAYAMRPGGWSLYKGFDPAGLELAELAVRRYTTAFGMEDDKIVAPIILVIKFLASGLNHNAFGESHKQRKNQLEILIAHAEDVAKASDDPELLPDFYQNISKLGLKGSKRYAEKAARLFDTAYGPEHPRTLIARMSAAAFKKGTSQAKVYERILADAEGVEEFNEYRFALHQKLSISYLQLGSEAKATRHLQAAGRLTITTGDSEYRPLFKIAPVYPRRAAARGIQGYVLLEFTVTSEGAVRNPKVLESRPRGIFERAAVEAAQHFRYLPKYVNGEPIEVQGVRNRIAFDLSD